MRIFVHVVVEAVLAEEMALQEMTRCASNFGLQTAYLAADTAERCRMQEPGARLSGRCPAETVCCLDTPLRRQHAVSGPVGRS